MTLVQKNIFAYCCGDILISCLPQSAIDFQVEIDYNRKVLEQSGGKKAVIVALLRIWFAAFLAAKIDQSVGWSWGLVFLPVWLYLFMQYAFAVYYHYWCVRRLHNVSHRQSLTLCFSVFCFCFCFLYINNL